MWCLFPTPSLLCIQPAGQAASQPACTWPLVPVRSRRGALPRGGRHPQLQLAGPTQPPRPPYHTQDSVVKARARLVAASEGGPRATRLVGRARAAAASRLRSALVPAHFHPPPRRPCAPPLHPACHQRRLCTHRQRAWRPAPRLCSCCSLWRRRRTLPHAHTLQMARVRAGRARGGAQRARRRRRALRSCGERRALRPPCSPRRASAHAAAAGELERHTIRGERGCWLARGRPACLPAGWGGMPLQCR